MINKIVAIQGDHPSKLNPVTDTSIFLANEIQEKVKWLEFVRCVEAVSVCRDVRW